MRSGTFLLRGELAMRVGRNMTRMEDPYFTPEDAFSDPTYSGGWPGDREGRAMLADTLLSRLTGRESAHLERFYQKMELNDLGYRGGIIAPKADEQQLSGHNWLTRALLEMYEWKHDERSRAMAERIVENLYLPLRGKYRSYPADPALRVVGGSFAGETDGLTHDTWITSTDIGCAFMCLDCLSQYYDLFRDQRVLELLREMIEVFRSIDLEGLKMQTHATLSATRGILRLYTATGDADLLALGKKVFSAYTRCGMSDAYMNYNWFDRPEWTEPCAMVDSLLVALSLYDITGDTEYLTFAHRAFYTGLGHAQRQNGGFGCDSCLAGEDGDLLSVRTPEAFWCCSMRGAEGLTRMAEHLVQEKDGKTLFNAYADGVFSLAAGSCEVRTEWPYEGAAALAFTGAWQGKKIALYAAERCTLTWNGAPLSAKWENGFLTCALPENEGTLCLTFDMPVEYRGARGKFTAKGRASLWKGPLMLGAAPGSAAPDVAALVRGKKGFADKNGTLFAPVNQVIFTGDMDAKQVLFPL